MQTIIGDSDSQALLGAYLTFLKLGNVNSYKAQAAAAIRDCSSYRIEQKVKAQSQSRDTRKKKCILSIWL